MLWLSSLARRTRTPSFRLGFGVWQTGFCIALIARATLCVEEHEHGRHQAYDICAVLRLLLNLELFKGLGAGQQITANSNRQQHKQVCLPCEHQGWSCDPFHYIGLLYIGVIFGFFWGHNRVILRYIGVMIGLYCVTLGFYLGYIGIRRMNFKDGAPN